MKMEIYTIKPDQDEIVNMVLINILSKIFGFPQEALRYYKKTWNIERIYHGACSSEHAFLMAWDKNKIFGILLGSTPEGGVVTIIWLFVLPEHQRKGIGSKLFKEACHRYRQIGCHKIKLTVPNKEIIKFYKKQEMKVEGFHPNR